MCVSDVWQEQPALRKLHIIVMHPPTTGEQGLSFPRLPTPTLRSSFTLSRLPIPVLSPPIVHSARRTMPIFVSVISSAMLSASSSNESNASSIPSVSGEQITYVHDAATHGFSDDWSPRHATVCRLYDILREEKLVHARLLH